MVRNIINLSPFFQNSATHHGIHASKKKQGRIFGAFGKIICIDRRQRQELRGDLLYLCWPAWRWGESGWSSLACSSPRRVAQSSALQPPSSSSSRADPWSAAFLAAAPGLMLAQLELPALPREPSWDEVESRSWTSWTFLRKQSLYLCV